MLGVGNYRNSSEERYAQREMKRYERRDREERERRERERLRHADRQDNQGSEREEPRRAVPDGIRTEERSWEMVPQVVRIDQGITGVVERKGGHEYHAAKGRTAAVGYLIKAERSGELVNIYFSKEHQLWLFDINTGKTTQEPHAVTEAGQHVQFANFPEPVYHKAFTSRDRSGRAFEPHVKRLTDGRVKDMEMRRESGQNIEEYKQRAEEFLKKAGDMFRDAGQY